MSDLPEIKKRDYPLRRGSEYYVELDGQPLVLPSVTHILGTALPKPQLVSWAARTAAKAALENPGLSVEEAAGSIYKKKAGAADQGRLIHSFAEAYGRGKSPDISTIPQELIPFAQAVTSFFEDEKILAGEIDGFPLIEFTVFNATHGYAGTADFGTLIDNVLSIYDWKSGKGVYLEGHLQQIAYLNAEYIYASFENPDTKEQTRKCIPMPKHNGAYLVHVRNDGGYSKIRVNGSFDDFLKVMDVYKILKRGEE